MPQTDRLRARVAEIHAAVGLLTRLPLPQRASLPPGGETAWCWPLIGVVLGAMAAFVASLALWCGLTPGVAAAITLATLAMLTGAMHEDGLADTADGLWGGWTPARRLEIMKDSHIGSYGVLALLLVTLARWSALTVVLAMGAQWPVLVAVAALSRAPMALIMALLPNARGAGLSHGAGRPDRRRAALAGGIALLMAMGVLGWAGFAMALAAAVISALLAALARAKINGQTGDILGAAQQLADVAALATAAALLT